MYFKLICQNANKIFAFRQVNLLKRTFFNNPNTCLKFARNFTKFPLTNFQTRTLFVNNVHCNQEQQETTNDLENIDYDLITKGDEELKKKLKVLVLEIDLIRQGGGTVPSRIKTQNWIELLKLETRTKRRKYLTFIFKNEMKSNNFKIKKEERKELREKEKELNSQISSEGRYGINANTIVLRIYDQTITRFENSNLIRAMLFGQKLIIDCSYDKYMTTIEANNCGKQLKYLFSQNRLHPDPFNLYLCNINKECSTLQRLKQHIPTLYDDEYPINLTEKSYMDLFPKDKLVYLTPHCRNELETWDHDAIYIVGAMVDKHNQEPLSLGKAKENGIKYARLPLEKYLHWGHGGKSLTLDQVHLYIFSLS